MYTLEQLAALEEAFVRGERRVTFEDKSVEYRSIEELQVAIREVSRALRQKAIATGKVKPVAKQIRITTTKGF